MSLWVCYRNFKAFVRRYSWIDDIEGKRELIQMPNKKSELKFWLNRRCLRQQTELNFFPGNRFYRPMVVILFHLFERPFIEKAESDYRSWDTRDLKIPWTRR